MVKIIIKIPKELQKEMKLYPGINWESVIKNAFIEKLKILQLAEKLGQQSKLTEK
ncbi:MAG: hypothetical protein NT038_09335 [Euryarchaeota archaeon]|nr:hypothetical protein [Euryarchaeota archaeon]